MKEKILVIAESENRAPQNSQYEGTLCVGYSTIKDAITALPEGILLTFSSIIIFGYPGQSHRFLLDLTPKTTKIVQYP